MRNLFCTAILVVLAGATAACGRRPLPQTDGDGGIGGGPSRGAGGSAGAGGTTVVDECLNHDIDLPSATLTGTLTINGGAAGGIPSARILLRNGLNDLVEIPFLDGAYVAHVAPGSYDVFFSSVAPVPTPDGPANRLAFLQQVTVARGDTTRLDIDVPVTSVAGTITINGAPLAADDEVSLSLRNAAGDIVPIASSSHGSFTARLVPGTFDLFFTADVVSDGSRTPINQLARIARNVVVTAGGAGRLDVDVPSAPVTGAVVITGLPAGDEDAATLVLRNASGDTVRIALTNGASYGGHVVPGSYDLYVSGASGPASLANQNARLRTGVIIAPGGTALNIDVPSVPVEGAIRIDGVPPGSNDSVYLVLRNAAGDQALILWDADGGYSVRVVPGKYDLFYAQGRAATSPVPANQLARLQADVVVDPAGTTRLDIDVLSTTVMGSLKINGAPADAGNSGILQLRSASGDRVTIGNTSGPSFSSRVVPGKYDLFYVRTATPSNTTTVAPANQAAKLRTGIVVPAGGPVALDVDIPSATVTGAITINGGPAGQADVGTIFLQSEAGDIAAFPLTGGGSYTARLIPGNYDIYFSRADSVGSTTPMNTLVKLRCFTVP